MAMISRQYPLVMVISTIASLSINDCQAGTAWFFEEVSNDIGASWNHSLIFGPIDTRDFWTGGLAAADIDQDGFVDVYVTRGDQFAGRLLRNLGNGQFEDVANEWNLVVSNGTREASYASGAAFADIDGNGYPDLFLPGVREFGLRLYLNNGSSFTESGSSWGLANETEDQLSLGFADVNGDHRLDVAATHWDNGQTAGGTSHLWLNQNNQLISAGASWGVSDAFASGDYSFTANFADFNGDHRPDLVISSDFNTSQCYLNQQGNQFLNTTDETVITDENGMGSAIGDFDNDGDMDWFVTSIYYDKPNPGWGITGNRLYRNDGTGQFTDVTDTAGVREGFWGWGACMEDFNNDGLLDIYHVNGWNPVQSPFQSDPARLYLNQGQGQFIDTATQQQVGDTGQGRGILCFDYDRDGDIDIFINNNMGNGRIYRNNASTTLAHHWLGIRLQMPGTNHQAIGAKITINSSGQQQYREMRIPNHFLSTSPAEVFFGFSSTNTIQNLNIVWPDGVQSTHLHIATNQWVNIQHPALDRIYQDNFELSAP